MLERPEINDASLIAMSVDLEIVSVEEPLLVYDGIVHEDPRHE